MINISASIVIYKENPKTLSKVIKNFLAIPLKSTLIILDNSPTDSLKTSIKNFPSVLYIHQPENIGFGAGHNKAFQTFNSNSNIHLIINPDIYFDPNEIYKMIVWMHENSDIALSVPLVYYPNGDKQHTIRHIPLVTTLFKRRFNIFGIFDDFIKKDEFQNTRFYEVTEIPFAHGCFFIFQTNVFKSLQGFDERFFMYMEDVDIFIRAKKFGKTVLHPQYKIYHEFRKGSSKSIKLFLWHIRSAIKFFLKYKY